MARTVNEIKAQMLAEKQAQSSLNALTSTSQTAFWNLYIYLVAVAINIFEQIMDLFKVDIEAVAAKSYPGSAKWIQSKVFEFQYSATTPQYVEMQSDFSLAYPIIDSSPSIDDLELEIRAYVELYGEAPELIVIDNLMNVVAETDNEWAGLRAIMMELHDMARKTEACVLVLHHVSEQSEYGSTINPPARRAIHGKVSQLPALILTLGYDPQDNVLRVAVVKNRFGPHAADGKDYAGLFTNYGACQINDADAYGRMYRHQAMASNSIQG